MWVFLSPIIAGNTWNLSHVCVFNDQPSLPDDADKTLDDEAKATVLGKVIDAAEITGFARVKSPTRPFPNLRLIGKE